MYCHKVGIEGISFQMWKLNFHLLQKVNCLWLCFSCLLRRQEGHWPRLLNQLRKRGQSAGHWQRVGCWVCCRQPKPSLVVDLPVSRWCVGAWLGTTCCILPKIPVIPADFGHGVGITCVLPRSGTCGWKWHHFLSAAIHKKLSGQLYYQSLICRSLSKPLFFSFRFDIYFTILNLIG